MDWTSAEAGWEISAVDQLLGIGDGRQVRFQLVKHYGETGMGEARKITRPCDGSVVIAVDGLEVSQGWVLEDRGEILFENAPAVGSVITAGYAFDVPVRFARDALDISFAGVAAGEISSVPLVEVRE